MITAEDPGHIPIILPNDKQVLESVGALPAVMLSAICAVNPRLEPLRALARARADVLLVDPKTPHFQFEGYLSMPDYRALPYSAGRHTLGGIWRAEAFTRPERRLELIDSAFGLQRELGADVLVAPYFYVRDAASPWLDISRNIATEAIEAAATEPVWLPVCVDIDALIGARQRDALVAAYSGVEPAAYWVIVVNYDERRADARDVRGVLAFQESLGATGRPVILAYVGRTGLLAVANGAAGYASGTHALEAHPRQFFREQMGSNPANTYYLHECMIHAPVKTAEAMLGLDERESHQACTCRACEGSTSISRMVSRRLALHALLRRREEIGTVAATAVASRKDALVERFSRALARAAYLAEALDGVSDRRLDAGEYHYLEILREVAGGPPATIPFDDGFD